LLRKEGEEGDGRQYFKEKFERMIRA